MNGNVRNGNGYNARYTAVFDQEVQNSPLPPPEKKQGKYIYSLLKTRRFGLSVRKSTCSTCNFHFFHPLLRLFITCSSMFVDLSFRLTHVKRRTQVCAYFGGRENSRPFSFTSDIGFIFVIFRTMSSMFNYLPKMLIIFLLCHVKIIRLAHVDKLPLDRKVFREITQ